LSVYKVREAKPEPPTSGKYWKKTPGVPFYSKSAICRQTATYLEPFAEVTLTKVEFVPSVEKDKNEKVEVVVGPKRLSLADAYALQGDVTGAVIDLSKYEELIDKLIQAQPFESCYQNLGKTDDTGKDRCPTAVLVENQVTREVVVDYGKTYYYNVKRPWVGSASSTLELNSDGTLSKATAALEAKTFETILGVVPAKELLSKAVGVEPEAAAPNEALVEGTPVRVKINISQKYLQHRLTKDSESKSSPCALDHLENGGDGVAYSSEIFDPGGKKSEAKKDDQPKISISGEIALPKEKKEDG